MSTEYMSAAEMPQPLSFREFIEVLGRLMDRVWRPGWGQLTPAWPKRSAVTAIKTPIIAYRLLHKRPFDGGSARDIRRRPLHTLIDPNNPQDVTEVYIQKFTGTLRFGVWTQDYESLLEWVGRLEDLMETYRGVFQAHGVELFYSEMRYEEPPDEAQAQGLECARVEYQIILPKLTFVKPAVIQQVAVQVQEVRTGAELVWPTAP